MTPGANMMLRELGIILFLASVGLSSGTNFVSTIANGGYVWMLYGASVSYTHLRAHETVLDLVCRLLLEKKKKKKDKTIESIFK